MPYAKKRKVEEELRRLQYEGILIKMDWSEWATPTVPVPKKDGSVRLCGDYKVTVNLNYKQNHTLYLALKPSLQTLLVGRNSIRLTSVKHITN